MRRMFTRFTSEGGIARPSRYFRQHYIEQADAERFARECIAEVGGGRYDVHEIHFGRVNCWAFPLLAATLFWARSG